MSDPILKSMKHTPPPAESAPIDEALLIQATEAARAVAVELKHAARYGKAGYYPSATNLQGVRMLDEDWTLAVIVVAIPNAHVAGAGEFIKTAFEGTVAEHQKAQRTKMVPDPENETE